MISVTKNNLYRAYADTSVFGGVFDEEFKTPSKIFFAAVQNKTFQLITSELVHQELQAAPPAVLRFFEECLAIADIAEVTDIVLKLQQAYIQAGIVTEKYSTDAMHVALATVSQANLIVSWNFKHIVNFQKIPLYNAVNTLHGLGPIAIYSPLEIIADED